MSASALILAGYNTFSVINLGFGGDTTDSQKSLVRVYLNSSYSVSSLSVTVLNFTSKSYDLNSNFDLINDQFISPNNGYYRFHLRLEMTTASTAVNLVMLKDGELYSQGNYNNNYRTISFSDIIYLQFGSSVNFTISFVGDTGSIIGTINGDRTHLTVEEI